LEGTRKEEKKEQKKSMDFEDTDITYALVLLPSFSLSLSLSPESLSWHSSRKKTLQGEFLPKPNLIRDNVGAYQELLILTNWKDKIRVFSNSKKNISGLQFLSIIINSERIRFIVLELHQLERIKEHTISLWPL
jgi:hypothetical protein